MTTPETATTPPTGLDRRTMIKAAAWSVPVIVLATAVPAAAATSGPPPAPCVTPTLSTARWDVISGSLGTELGASGWTPVAGSAENPSTPGPEYTGRSAYYSDAIGWAGLADVAAGSGFVSVNNRSAVGAQTVIRATYEFAVQRGITYTVPLSVKGTSPWLAVQLLDIDLIGTGSVVAPIGGSGTTVVKVGLGAEYAAWAHPGYEDMGATTRAFSPQFISAADGTLTVQYTFTLTDTYTSWSGEKQNNADMWVSQPIPSCPAA